MKVNAKVESICKIEQVQTQNGPMNKQFVIVRTNEQFPKLIAIVGIGDTCAEIAKLQIGLSYDFYVDIYSREWNGKWYTDVRMWKVTQMEWQQQTQQQTQQPMNNTYTQQQQQKMRQFTQQLGLQPSQQQPYMTPQMQQQWNQAQQQTQQPQQNNEYNLPF